MYALIWSLNLLLVFFRYMIILSLCFNLPIIIMEEVDHLESSLRTNQWYLSRIRSCLLVLACLLTAKICAPFFFLFLTLSYIVHQQSPSHLAPFLSLVCTCKPMNRFQRKNTLITWFMKNCLGLLINWRRRGNNSTKNPNILHISTPLKFVIVHFR